MRKLIAIAAILALPLTVGACDDSKSCKPGAIRQSVTNPEKFWVCNKSGTGETPLTGPIPPGDPKNGWS